MSTSIGGAPESKPDILTRRERYVLELIGVGRTINSIATRINISSQTARVQLGNTMKTLELKNRNDAIRFAVTNATAIAEDS